MMRGCVYIKKTQQFSLQNIFDECVRVKYLMFRWFHDVFCLLVDVR